MTTSYLDLINEVRETLRGFRQKYPARRLWAVFEPRSNTSRRNVLQNELIGMVRLRERRIVWLNLAAERLLGYSQNELLGQSTRTLSIVNRSN